MFNVLKTEGRARRGRLAPAFMPGLRTRRNSVLRPAPRACARACASRPAPVPRGCACASRPAPVPAPAPAAPAPAPRAPCLRPAAINFARRFLPGNYFLVF